MINAFIQNNGETTFIMDFPCDNTTLYKELQSVDIKGIPSKIKMTDYEDSCSGKTVLGLRHSQLSNSTVSESNSLLLCRHNCLTHDESR